ncbi:hypothetical protein ABIA33_006977 [Streptacidiphilus sp. MAP12-16]
MAKTATYTREYADSNGFLTLLGDGRVLTGAHGGPRGRGVAATGETVAIRARIPLGVLRDTIRPFPSFSEIYVAVLQALHERITLARQPVGQDAS